MKKMYKVCLLSAAIILLGGCGKVGDTENEGAEMISTETENAESKFSFEGQDVEGNIISSDILLESKLTMVNVWATYCNPCLREMPGLGELAGEYEPEEFQIIGIVSDVQENADQKALDYVSSLIDQTGADYTHLLLNQSLYEAFLTDVAAVPTTFFVNEDGELLDVVVGSLDKEAWEDKINAFLEEQ